MRSLGLTVDSRLRWDAQIDELCSALARSCYAIYKIRDTVSFHVLKTFYFAYVQSRLSYGIIFWGSSAFLQRLFVMQKRILRCMLFISSRTSCRGYFADAEILTLPGLYVYRLLVFYRENQQLFPTNRDVSMSVSTRYSQRLSVPQHRLTLYERSAYYGAITAYNALPEHIRNSSNTGAFCRSVKSYLTRESFYSFEEFLNKHTNREL